MGHRLLNGDQFSAVPGTLEEAETFQIPVAAGHPPAVLADISEGENVRQRRTIAVLSTPRQTSTNRRTWSAIQTQWRRGNSPSKRLQAPSISASASPYGQYTGFVQGVYEATLSQRRALGCDLSLSPTNVATVGGGGVLQVKGIGLTNSTGITLDGLAGVGWTVASDTLASFTTVAHAAGGPFPATVSWADGSSVSIPGGISWA
jgi:hypothetical protein